MITTVTLNPCIDLTMRMPDLKLGELNLASSTRTDVAGKGVNVSRVLRELGCATFCTGITFDGNGQLMADYLEQHSIAADFAVAHGNIRTNIKVYDESQNSMTELNQYGDPVPPLVLDQYFELLKKYAQRSDMVVFSGRIPAGASADIYRQSLKAIRAYPCKVILDAEGAPLRRALLQKPYLIKPNLYELGTLIQRKVRGVDDAVQACQKVIRRGIRVVCVSMGGDGALITDGEKAYLAPPLDIQVRGFQGAGDSMVGGICKAIKTGGDIREMLRCGVAAASASLIREGTLLCRRADFDRFLSQVEIRELPIPREEQEPELEEARKTS